MCGIAGIMGFHTINPDAVIAMTGVQAHRGPDDSGLWQNEDGRVVLGHRRLSILDTSAKGHQPMVNQTQAVTFNGEIYNFKELATHLKAQGAVFKSHCDTEVLLAAYEHWGTDCVSQFNGMFSFAVYDGARKRLFCARDRFGEKPFLFHEGDGFFAFASEYKSLFTLSGIKTDWDQVRLGQFLHNPASGLDDGRQTVFDDIQQLLPGECMVVDLETLTPEIERYWDIPTPNEPALSHLDAVARFTELLTDSVRLRLRSDVPVGSCLSGGLDSGAIVCLAAKDNPGYQTFTGRFPGTSADEWAYATQIVDETGVSSHVTEPTADGFLEDLADFAWANELPVGSSSQYAQWCVFKLAKDKDVTVLLDGQGADEILGGYEQYFSAYLKDTGGADEAAIRQRYPDALSVQDQGWKTRLPQSLRRKLAHMTNKGSDVLFGLSPALGQAVAKRASIGTDPRFGALHGALERDALHAQLPTLLRYGDRNSMAHSREIRLPFTDHRIAELVFSLTPDSLMGAVQTKRLLRDAMTGILPEPVRTQWNKRGFLPPQENWFAGALGPHARAIFNSPEFSQSDIWDQGWWNSTLQRFENGERHLAWTMWKPIAAEAWQHHFVARAAAQEKVKVFPS